jgi:hypothetical protein
MLGMGRGRETVMATMMVGSTREMTMGIPLGGVALGVYTRKAAMQVVITVMMVWMRVLPVVTIKMLLSRMLTHLALASLVLTSLILDRLVNLVLNLRFGIGQFHDVFRGAMKR